MSQDLQVFFSQDLPASVMEFFMETMERVAVLPVRPGEERGLSVPRLPVFARLRLPSGRFSPLKPIVKSPFTLTAEAMGLADPRAAAESRAESLSRKARVVASPRHSYALDAALESCAELTLPKAPSAWSANTPIPLADGELTAQLDIDGQIQRSAGGSSLSLVRPPFCDLTRAPGELKLECARCLLTVRLPGDLAKIRVRVRRRQGHLHTVEVLYETHSVWADSLTAYLLHGDYTSATSLLEEAAHAEGLLSEKFRDPYAAAVGAYFLLRTASGNYPADWLRRLADAFPDLPDGAVLWAWHLILQESRIAEGVRYLMIAAERGLPVFAEGRRLLFDGLRRAGAASERYFENWQIPNRRLLWASPLTAWQDDVPHASGPQVSFVLRPASFTSRRRFG